MNSFVQIENLPSTVRSAVTGFVEKLLARHPGKILSVVVYGSAATNNFLPKVSDINLCVIVAEINPEFLQRCLGLIAEWRKHKIATPLFLTREYIRTSQDVFPIEFLDIQERHILIYGEDIFTRLNIDSKHLRISCEQQLKGKLLRLRQSYLEVGEHVSQVEQLMKASLRDLIPTFRHLLRLRGLRPNESKEIMIRQVEETFSLEKNVFGSVYADSVSDQRIAGQLATDHWIIYITQFDKLVTAVDLL